MTTTIQSCRAPGLTNTVPPLEANKRDANDELQSTFTQFVGQTFFGQMIKAMRSTVGKPAYFDGGQGEEVFRSQLDQTLAEHMTEATARQFADPMFKRQFPHQAASSGSPRADKTNSDLSRLDQLRRR